MPRSTRTTASALALLVAGSLAALVALAGCGEDEPAERQAAAPLAPATSSAAASAEPPAEPTGAATSPTATPATSAAASPSFPPQSQDLEQGGTYWAVYLAVARTEQVTPQLRAAEASARAAGYEATTGEVDCDRGARQALRLAPTGTYFGTSVFFDSAAQAKQFVDAYEPGVVGTAKVQAFCMD